MRKSDVARSREAKRIFLLSPANSGGARAGLLLNSRAKFDLAAKVRTGAATLGEVYAFISGLYFRGKLAYSAAFADPPPAVPGALVITPGRGLLPPETVIDLAQLREIGSVPVDIADPHYRQPLTRDAHLLGTATAPDCSFVLLGSIATTKYIEPLLEVFGDRLLFPSEFVGRGDMSRGGLMLRCARAGLPMTYVPVPGAVRHGPRPARLPGRY